MPPIAAVLSRKISKLAEIFAQTFSEEVFSPAEIQSYLLKWKADPEGRCPWCRNLEGYPDQSEASNSHVIICGLISYVHVLVIQSHDRLLCLPELGMNE